MTWLRRALPAVAAGMLVAAPVAAQVSGRPVEASIGGGLFKYDLRAHMKRSPAFTASAGWRVAPWLTLEGVANHGLSKADTVPHQDHNFTYAGLDLRWNLRSAQDRVVPFLLSGAGYGRSSTVGHPPPTLERGAGSLGMGVLYSLGPPRAYLRAQVRDVFFRERDASEFSNHLAATVGVQWVFLGKYSDQDRDGVRDWLDKCSVTPFGAAVNASGCPADADADSVFDGLDKCPDTPKGCKVTHDGCPIDADGDGVCDGIDACADTPKGCTVDARGCPDDADGDGVCDGIDTCAGTVKGCTVDPSGCSTDTDKDGVCDDRDRCPNSPTGAPVDTAGCPARIGAFERMLLDSGLVRVKGIGFDAARLGLASGTTAELDSLGPVLQQYAGLRIEIGGPTDVTGERAVRERLSLDQARAVLDYLKKTYPLIDASQYTLRGFQATATTLFGAKNRRVEFKVLNREVLGEERAKRGLGSGSQ